MWTKIKNIFKPKVDLVKKEFYWEFIPDRKIPSDVFEYNICLYNYGYNEEKKSNKVFIISQYTEYRA